MNKWKFLLVDDSQMSNRILKDILNYAGYTQVTTVRNAFEALRLLTLGKDAKTFDIIITDLYMPGINGIELCRRVKKEKQYENVPILMITSSQDVNNLQEAFDAGVIEYIIKPFNKIEAITRIKSVLRLKEEMNKRLERELEVKKFNKALVDDLNIAKQLQLQLLPKPIWNEQIYIQGFYMPVAFLGGDLYYWQKLENGRYGVMLLDVMGHGTATSMICMYIRSVLPRLMMKDKKPDDLIKNLNSFIREFNEKLPEGGYHCTAFYIIIDTVQKKVEYVNAGHPPLILAEDKKEIRWLKEGCIPLGIFEEMVIESETLTYEDTTHIFMYSDGLDEVLKQQVLDVQYLLSYVMHHSTIVDGKMGMVEKLFNQLESLHRDDDVSLVLIKLLHGKDDANESDNTI